METATPMLAQYHRIKSQHRDCILFFRLGDFYEMFYEDARLASRALDLVLTSRGKGSSHAVPMCGIPYHAADGYISRLIKSGFKVAICEQTQDPGQAKGLVERDVIRIITSGTYLDEQSPEARYLLCLNPGAGPQSPLGLAFVDPSMGAVHANEYPTEQRALDVISRLPVYECVYPAGREERFREFLRHPLVKAKNIVLSPLEDWAFNPEMARKALCDHFGVTNLAGFGLADLPSAVAAAAALLEYLKLVNKQPLKHIDRLSLYADQDYVHISPAATYGLELDTLFKTIDQTLCALGKRKLRYWLFHPLVDPAAVLERQAAVTLLKDAPDTTKRLKEILGRFPDIEKSLSKLSCGYTHARDILALRNALCALPDLAAAVEPLAAQNRAFRVSDIPGLRRKLEAAVNPDMPLTNAEGKIIKTGYHNGLDELRSIQDSGRQWLKDFQSRESKRTGISSLKVGYNKVFGYYIEITRANLAAAPSDYIRKQTLVNGERFITPELKEYEDKILTAESRILRIEADLVEELKAAILGETVSLHRYAQEAARLDALYSLAVCARKPGYTAPQISGDPVIDIREGRHPVVERMTEDKFVPNDIYLDDDRNHLLILTGPNMAGKSTYIRQTAILVILAQMGSYLPAGEARVGVVDRIYTRIGAHDDISKGQSTFMVEMTEAADILNNLTPRSLVILDEIGRGTSTFDGLSLAWALAEHLQQRKARTLFATHFHELTALAGQYPGIKNYNVAVKEWKDEIIFLHKIVPGSSDDSYGIYVAKLAGVPHAVIDRAKNILGRLELQSDLKDRLTESGAGGEPAQMTLFAPAAGTRAGQAGSAGDAGSPDPLVREIREALDALNINTLTPLDALNKLQELKERLQKNIGPDDLPGLVLAGSGDAARDQEKLNNKGRQP